MHTHTYMYTYTHTYLHTCIHTITHTCMHTCMHTYMQTYVQRDSQCVLVSSDYIVRWSQATHNASSNSSHAPVVLESAPAPRGIPLRGEGEARGRRGGGVGSREGRGGGPFSSQVPEVLESAPALKGSPLGGEEGGIGGGGGGGRGPMYGSKVVVTSLNGRHVDSVTGQSLVPLTPCTTEDCAQSTPRELEECHSGRFVFAEHAGVLSLLSPQVLALCSSPQHNLSVNLWYTEGEEGEDEGHASEIGVC